MIYFELVNLWLILQSLNTFFFALVLFSNVHFILLWITLVACLWAVIPVITRNWCNCRLHSAILSAEIISFTRDAPSSFTLIQFLSDPALSEFIFFLSLGRSLSFSRVVTGRRDECYAHTAGAYAFLQGSASCCFCLHLQNQSQAVRHVHCPWLHTSPLFLYPSSGHPTYFRTSHCLSQETVPKACHNQQLCQP